MMDYVDELLIQWRQSSFVWGQSDCLLSVGDYIHSRGGLNISGLYHGTYSDAAGALERMQQAGGPLALIDATGIPRASEARRGDVVVIDVATGIAGVHTGQGVAVRRERGLAEINWRFVKILQAWAVP